MKRKNIRIKDIFHEFFQVSGIRMHLIACKGKIMQKGAMTSITLYV